MIIARAFAGKHYAVLGLARSGLATVEALLASGAKVTAWDDDEATRSSLRAKLVGRGTSEAGGGVNSNANYPSTIASSGNGSPPHAVHGEELTVTDFTTADLTQFDSIVVTPGLPLNRHPIAQAAREAGVEIIGDIELFARARPELPPHKVVGITGTNGKSTTTALVHHILQSAGVPSLMGGNIGLPILSQDPLPEGGVYVLELSSYQIDLTQSLDCDVAVLLNITPDHLDRYESFEAYAASKARLFEMQGSGSRAIVFEEDASTRAIANQVEERLFSVSSNQWSASGVSFAEGFYHLRDAAKGINKKYIYLLGQNVSSQDSWPSLQGPHNAKNVVAAVAVIELLGKVGRTYTRLHNGLRTFPGLPHRMEPIADRGGVLFVNDSKATNAEAAAPALAAFPRIRWIVGGQAKGDGLGEMEAQLGHVVAAYTIGEAGPMFARLLRERGVKVIECETLENATKRAAEDSQSGETVLLSPACASFDQFRDFEARGDRFRELVGAL